MRGAALIDQNCRPPPHGRLLCRQTTPSKLLVTPNRKRVVSRPQGGASLAHRTTICLRPSHFDDGGTPAYRANLQTWRANPAPRFPIWRFLLAVTALPPLLAFLAAASWLSWMCFQGITGPPAAIIALVGIAALAALIRRHTGIALGAALSLVALVGLAGLVWVVFALLALALVAGG